MKQNIILIFFFSCFGIEQTLFAQKVSIKRLLLLQNSTLLEMQNFLDTNFWVLNRTVTLSEADSRVWEHKISRFKDSIRKIEPKSFGQKERSFNSKIINTENQTPLYFVYFPSNANTLKGELIPTDFTIRLPKQVFFQSIVYGFYDYLNRTFHNSLSISYKGSSIKEILKEISSFNIPKNSTFIEYGEETIQRIYLLKNQVITITTFTLDKSNDSIKTFEISIYSRSDYDFLNATQYNLKGKVDFIQ